MATAKGRKVGQTAIRTMYHEAGHAVVAHVLGWRIRELWIAGPKAKGPHGMCQVEAPRGVPLSVHDDLRIGLASSGAERILSQQRGLKTRGKFYKATDFFDIWKRTNYSGADWQRLSKLDSEAEALLREPANLAALDALVSVLMERYAQRESPLSRVSLAGYTVHRIIRQARGEALAS